MLKLCVSKITVKLCIFTEIYRVSKSFWPPLKSPQINFFYLNKMITLLHNRLPSTNDETMNVQIWIHFSAFDIYGAFCIHCIIHFIHLMKL